MAFTRLFDILPYQLTHYEQHDAICNKVDGEWKKYSTEECLEIINKLSLAFLKLGVKKNDKIAIISPNRPEWNFVDLAILQTGAVDVPIYPTISQEEYKYIFKDAAIKWVFVADKELFDKITQIKADLPELKEIYSFDELSGVKHWTELLKDVDLSQQDELDEIKKSVSEEDLATLIYTSGTTGTPKGVMLTHRNIASNVKSTAGCLPLNENNRILSFLPLCHIFERMVTYTYMYLGVSIYYAESMDTIGENIKEVKPHFFSSVPRLLEKVYEKIVIKGHELSGIKKSLFFWALNLGLEYDNQGKNGAWYNAKLSVARKLIFSKWQEALGGELIGIVTGAAALQPRLARVFNAAGIMVREGYGLTETSPVICFNRFEDGEWYIGTVGPSIPGVEVKLADDGEILTKGPNVMKGYYNNPDATKEVMDDQGWFHTGDIGEMAMGKFLKITDRKKEVFKTSGGKYVAPQPIENKMKEASFVEQIMVVGENQKFTGALIVPAFEKIKEWSKRHNLNLTTNEDIVHSPEVREKIKKDIDKLNQNFSHIEQIKRFELVPQEWSIETEELTPTLKLKRKIILAKYSAYLDKIYLDTSPTQ